MSLNNSINCIYGCQCSVILKAGQELTIKLMKPNNLIPKDSISYYLQMEEKNVQKISDDLLDILNLYEFVTSTNDSLYLPIRDYAEKECSKNEI